MNTARLYLATICVSAVSTGLADTSYESPLTGENKTDWFISDFVDHGDGVTPLDYNGGFQTYAGHWGTDIMLYDFKTMQDGIDVLAAAPGTVEYVMDGLFDMQTGDLVSYVAGNYITVRHADSSLALYYHFKRSSILVTNGQQVAAGQKLGEAGSSGFASYPHLHFQVTLDDLPMEIMTNQCGQSQCFDWFDSYSNQVRMQVVGMGTTVTNDPYVYGNFLQHTPRSYSIIGNDMFVTWAKYVGMAAGDAMRIRFLALAGPGETVDLSPWPWQYEADLNCGYVWWIWRYGDGIEGTTYRMQYRWNDGPWIDGPGANIFTVNSSASPEYVSRESGPYARYAAAANPAPAYPYTSWATAANSIQDAVDAALDGDTIYVTNGVYETGATTIHDGSLCRVALTRPVYVRSINGPRFTAIRGAGAEGGAAVRCAYLTNGAMLAGFTLSGGAAPDGRGGGAWCEPRATLCNCVVTGNTAGAGGGIYGGVLANCVAARNHAETRGGGIYGDGWQDMCTVADNTAGVGGGGIHAPAAFSCIVYHNTVNGATNNLDFSAGGYAWHTCAAPLPAGYANIADEPLFLDRASGSYRLRADSPCVDRVAMAPVIAWSYDADFRSRLVNGALDIGGYEYNPTPGKPGNVAASDGERADGVLVQWDAVSYAASYELFRAMSNDIALAEAVGGATNTCFFDNHARKRVPYFYWVRAVGAAGLAGEWSEPDAGWRKALPAGYAAGHGSDLSVFDSNSGLWYIASLSSKFKVQGSRLETERPNTDHRTPIAAEAHAIAWAVPWGWSGAQPVSGDYDGDGISDLSVFDSNSGLWYIATLTSIQYSVSSIQNPERLNTEFCTLNTGSPRILAWAVPWGWSGARPVSGDYDGDGISDLAVFDSNSGLWYIAALEMESRAGDIKRSTFNIQRSTFNIVDQDRKTPNTDHPTPIADLLSPITDRRSPITPLRILAWAVPWGWSGAQPVSGDYDGDGKSDLAVFDTQKGAWYIGSPDGLSRKAGLEVFVEGAGWNGTRFVGSRAAPGAARRAVLAWDVRFGWPGAWAVSGDFDNDGADDLAVFDTATGAWYARALDGRILLWAQVWGWPGAVPVPGAAW